MAVLVVGIVIGRWLTAKAPNLLARGFFIASLKTTALKSTTKT